MVGDLIPLTGMAHDPPVGHRDRGVLSRGTFRYDDTADGRAPATDRASVPADDDLAVGQFQIREDPSLTRRMSTWRCTRRRWSGGL